jgi:hypothetical protein
MPTNPDMPLGKQGARGPVPPPGPGDVYVPIDDGRYAFRDFDRTSHGSCLPLTRQDCLRLTQYDQRLLSRLNIAF